MLPTPAPAQFGGVLGPAVAAVGLLALLVPITLAVWVGYDAADHSDHPLAWALATLVGGLSPLSVGSLAVVLLYRRTRDELGSIAPPSVRRESEIRRGEVLGEAVDERRRVERSRSELTDGGKASESQSNDDLGGFEMADPVESDEAAIDGSQRGS